MYLSLRYIIIFFIVVSIYYGVWQFIWLKLTRKYYGMLKQDKESYFDFLCRWSPSLIWGIKRRLGFSKIYGWKVFDRLVHIKGILYILVGIALLVFLIVSSRTKYGVLLDIVL